MVVTHVVRDVEVRLVRVRVKVELWGGVWVGERADLLCEWDSSPCRFRGCRLMAKEMRLGVRAALEPYCLEARQAGWAEPYRLQLVYTILVR